MHKPKSQKIWQTEPSWNLCNAKCCGSRCATRCWHVVPRGKSRMAWEAQCHFCGFCMLTFAILEFGLDQQLLRVGHFGEKFWRAHLAKFVAAQDTNRAGRTGMARCIVFLLRSVLRRWRKTNTKLSWWAMWKWNVARAKHNAQFVPLAAGNSGAFGLSPIITMQYALNGSMPDARQTCCET